MLIDTSRNGWGGTKRPAAASSSTDLNTWVNESRIDRRTHAGNWCNQTGAGLGERPKAAPAAGIDAYVWIKPPGESDGSSKLIPNGADNPGGKGFDQMCDPTYTGNARNGNNLTGSLPERPGLRCLVLRPVPRADDQRLPPAELTAQNPPPRPQDRPQEIDVPPGRGFRPTSPVSTRSPRRGSSSPHHVCAARQGLRSKARSAQQSKGQCCKPVVAYSNHGSGQIRVPVRRGLGTGHEGRSRTLSCIMQQPPSRDGAARSQRW